ncbi:MAG: alpha/beta fold hydrolase [Pseudomonadota bacterium]
MKAFRRTTQALAIAVTMGLSACAVGGAMAPPVDLGGASARTVATRASESQLLPVPGAAPLALSVWKPAAAPRVVIVAAHGFGDYAASTFATAGPAWAAEGALVYAYDQRGFGRNPSYGQWPSAETLISDYRTALDWARGQHPGVPLVALGHSMGGAVVAAALAETADASPVSATVLLAPAVWGGDRLNPAYRAAAWLAAALVPEKRFTGEGVVRIQASDNIPLLRRLGRDPLYLGPPSAREILGLVRLSDRALDALPRLRGPVLLAYGAKDQVIPRAAIEAAFLDLPHPKTYEEFPEGWHLLMRDLGSATVHRGVWQWVRSRLNSGYACAATLNAPPRAC